MTDFLGITRNDWFHRLTVTYIVNGLISNNLPNKEKKKQIFFLGFENASNVYKMESVTKW